MPQKGQITKHEWNRFAIRTKKCTHCGCIKTIYNGVSTYYVNSISQENEPPCITRKIQADGEDNNKA